MLYNFAADIFYIMKLCGVEQKALPMFGRATITLGIGPHFLVIALLLLIRYVTL